MRKAELSPGAAAACGRLEGLARLAESDLGRWMIEVAAALARRSRRRRSLEAHLRELRPGRARQ